MFVTVSSNYVSFITSHKYLTYQDRIPPINSLINAFVDSHPNKVLSVRNLLGAYLGKNTRQKRSMLDQTIPRNKLIHVKLLNSSIA